MQEDFEKTSSLAVVEYIGDPPGQLTTMQMLVEAMLGVDEMTKVQLLRSVQIREMSASTYIGNGLAIPHARMEEIDKLSISVGYFPQGVPWPTEEDKAELVVLLAVPHTYVQAYLLFMKKFVTWYSKIDNVQRKERWTQPGLLEEDISELLDV